MSPACAHAGAWVVPKGEQSIYNVTAGDRADANFYELNYYSEGTDNGHVYWVGSGWTEYSETLEEGSRLEVMVAAKFPLQSGADSAQAVQIGALYLSNPREGCSEGGAEVRWLGGMNLPQHAFVNLELAGRALDGGEECVGSRVDLTLGYQPGAHWLTLGQIFADTPLDGDASVKAQVSFVRFGARGGNGIQIGLRMRLDGEALEPALVLGLWRRPGD